MKLQKILPVFLIFAISGCSLFEDLAIPQSVSLKTNAKYPVTIGSMEYSFEEYLSAAKLKESMNSTSEESEETSIEFYDYAPDGIKEKSYLVRMALQEIPIDLGTYLTDMNLDSMLQSVKIDEQSFSVPDIKIDFEEDLEITKITDAVNALATINATSGTDVEVKFVVEEGNNFESISYKSGSLVITSPLADYSGSVSLKYNDQTISTATFANNSAALNLAGKSLYKEGMTLDFTGSQGIQMVGIINSGVIDKVSGFSANVPGLTNEQTVEIDTAASLKECVIGSGSMTMGFEIPDSWENANISPKFELSGGLNLTFESTDPVSLENQKFSTDDITVKTEIEVSFTNATIDFNDIPKIIAKTQIDEIKTITVELNAGDDSQEFKTELSEEIELPAESLSMIKEIELGECGFDVLYTSTLPEGNDIIITANSNFFGLDNTTGTLENTEDSESGTKTMSLTNQGGTTIKPAENNKVDISVKLDLPAWNSETKTITINNVKPNTEYKIAMEITPVINWDHITLDTSNFNYDNSENPLDTGINLSEMLGSFTESLNFNLSDFALTEVPFYLFCDMPQFEVLQNMAFKGKISAYTKDDKSDATFILGSETENAILSTESEPELTIEDSVVSTKITEESTIDLSELLNTVLQNSSNSQTLKINYSIGMTDKTSAETSDTSELTITYDDFQKLSETDSNAGSIKLSAILILPLSLEITKEDGVEVDVLELTSLKDDVVNSEDFFGRTEGGDLIADDVKKYADLIESVELSYKMDKMPFVVSNSENEDIQILVDLDGDGTKYEVQELELSGSKIELKDPIDYLEIYPLMPSIKIKIPQSTIYITKDMALNAIIKAAINTDGQVTVWEANSEETAEN